MEAKTKSKRPLLLNGALEFEQRTSPKNGEIDHLVAVFREMPLDAIAPTSSSFPCEQAAEKISKAVLTSGGPKDGELQNLQLSSDLPEGPAAQRLQVDVGYRPGEGLLTQRVLPGFRWTTGDRQLISTSRDS
jgi:hypothetical protein